MADRQQSYPTEISEDVYFNRLLIPLDSDSIYLQNTYTGQRWKWQWTDESNTALFPTPNRLDLSETQRVQEAKLEPEFSLVAGSQIYAPANAITMPEILATLPINETNKADIVKRFFSIVPRMRRPRPRRASKETYITARQQVLTLHNSGLLEYSESRPSRRPMPRPHHR